MLETPAVEARGRLLAYVATAAALILAAVLLRGAAWSSSATLHVLQETAATLLALIVGALALVRYYSGRERLFLVIGAAFLGTAVLDAYHTIVTFVAPPEDAAGAALFAPWSWFASRTYLAFFLFRLSLLPRPGIARGAASPLREGLVYAIAIALVLAALLALTLLPLPTVYAPDWPFPQPLEFVPAALLFGALVLTLRIRGWKRNVFEHWLVLSLLLGVGGQLLMASSSHQYDRWFDVAHLLRAASYACVLAGLLMSVFFTYRRLEESRRALSSANVTLQREIDERETAERELRIRTAYLEQLFESAPEAIVVVDATDRILRANAEFTAMFGYPTGDAVGRTIGELIVPPAAVREAGAVTHAVASGLTVSYETVRRRKDGSPVDVSILATPIRGAEGHVAVYGIYRDITDRKRAEAALQESAARLEAIVQAAPLGIITLDNSGIVRTWNPAAEEILALRSSQVLGRPLPLLTNDPETLSALDGIFDDRPLAGLEIQRDGPGASVISLSAAGLRDAAGQPSGILVIVADITDRRLAERTMREAATAAEQANRAKSEFLASVSHELRTPLNSVIGFTRVLLRNKGNNLRPTDIAYLERIAANGEHLLGVINDIIDLSRIEAGRVDLDPVPTDLGPLVEETIAQLAPRSGGDVEVVADVPEPLLPLRTDGRRLRQILINLIGNALKFTEHGTVRVTVEADSVTRAPLRIAVSDTGIGVQADRLEKIFAAFEQADRTTARRYGGTGLGLSISRGLCRELGYQLTAESEPGRGSTFTIHLQPADAPAPALV